MSNKIKSVPAISGLSSRGEAGRQLDLEVLLERLDGARPLIRTGSAYHNKGLLCVVMVV